ncbi:hypothetical protein CEG94_16440 [Shigella boydii]|nr:hypothetical protein CEG94_16440 [Shigella boydii]
MESYAIRLLSGPLNGCEYEILNGRLLVIIGNDVSLGRSDAFSELPENTIVVPGNDSNLLIVFYVQIMPDDFVMQLHRF